MKKLLIVMSLGLLLSSCTTKTYLYNWGSYRNSKKASDYEVVMYDYYHTQSPESVCALLCQYEYMVKHPGGTRGMIPPGICAEYGYLLLQPETAANFLSHATKKQKETYGQMGDYGAMFREKGMEMLQKEMELYPESSVFIGPLIKKFSHQ